MLACNPTAASLTLLTRPGEAVRNACVSSVTFWSDTGPIRQHPTGTNYLAFPGWAQTLDL